MKFYCLHNFRMYVLAGQIKKEFLMYKHYKYVKVFILFIAKYLIHVYKAYLQGSVFTSKLKT